MYDSILIATDGSEATRGAVANALGLAETYDATVHVLYVVDVRAISVDTEGFDEQPVLNLLEERGERVTAEIRRRAEERGLTAVTAVDPGTPAKRIRGYADEHGIDLLTMGTRGRSGIKRHLLGSVAERVLRNATIPVLTTRNAAAPIDPAYDDVLLPVDGSEQAARAADHAFDIAARYDATVHALSVIDASLVRSGDVLTTLESEAEAAVDAAKRRSEAAGVDVVGDVWTGTPARCLVEYAEQEGVDLLTTGTHPERGLDRFLHGSVVEQVVRSAPCPVLTVPNSDGN